MSIVVISKDEPQLGGTLGSLRSQLESSALAEGEVVVVDSSAGRLEIVHAAHPWVHWVDFQPLPGVAITIPHQRNAGVRAGSGDVVVFIDSGCIPCEGWLDRLLTPMVDGSEVVVSGRAGGKRDVYARAMSLVEPSYLSEAPTINLAVHRSVFDSVGEFDQRFAYGSDVDFTWRVTDAGLKIRYAADASVDHDWGDLRRRLRRARQYGAARVRLYVKHKGRVPRALREDPVPFVYPIWLLGLPIALKRRSYLLLLAVPLWRARKYPYPFEVVLTHVVQGVGSLEEVARLGMRRRRR